jgi:glycosyltransferase involved in cell wall biosynthesis
VNQAGPRYSFVVPAYQAEQTLAETLDGLLAQTFEAWECIVVDDGSTDGTAAIADRYVAADPRFRAVHQVNQGTAAAYNAGVRRATSDYVVLCSADDVLLPEHLSTMSAFVDSESAFDIWTSNGYLWRPGVSKTLVYDRGPDEPIRSESLADVIRVCFYGVGAVYRRRLFDLVGGYRLDVYTEDYDFWLRAMAKGAQHRYLPKALSLWRVSATQKSAGLEKVYESDMRLVTELRRDFALTPEQLKAVEDNIADRERLIARLHGHRDIYRDVLRPLPRRAIIKAIGHDRARRLKRIVKSAVGRAASQTS